MSKDNLRKTGQQVFAALAAQNPQSAADNFVQLCALCALDTLGFLPAASVPLWEGVPSSAALDSLQQGLCSALPQIFTPHSRLIPQWFLPDGAAVRLRGLYRSVPAQRVYGLSALLWEACAELPRRQSFAALRRSGHHTGPNAAYATQLFTPGWLGRFLMENSVGRLVGHTDHLEYYMGEPPAARTEAANITLLDPCVGGGQLLCRAFDLLYPRLLEEGMSPDRAVRHLLEQALVGLDLDQNALNICHLELMLLGRRHDPMLFERNIRPKLAAVRFRDGSFCPPGSLLAPGIEGFDRLTPDAACLLERQYDIVAANPPYMGLKGMDPALRSFLRKHYPHGRHDLYAAFALRCLQLTKPNGFTALLMPQGWLTLANFADLRQHYAQYHIPALLKLGAHAFPDIGGEVVQTAAFVTCKQSPHGPTALCDLSGFDSSGAKQTAFLSKQNRSTVSTPLAPTGLPQGCRSLGQTVRICQGLATGSNERFVRLWFEVDPNDIGRGCANRKDAADSGKRWFPYNKGGGFRRWWGNDLHVVDFMKDGEAIRRQLSPNGRPRARVQNADYYFRPGVTYSFVGSRNFSARITPAGAIFDVGGSTAFPQDGNCLTLAALLNSAAAQSLLLRRNPTVNFQVGDLAALPCPALGSFEQEVENLAQTCTDLARRHWQQAEPSPDFSVHPWAEQKEESLAQTAQEWFRHRQAENKTLWAAQNRLNQIYAQLLEEEFVPPQEAVHAPDLPEECRRFLSWCVGRVVGRFGGTPTDATTLDNLAARVEELLADLWGKDGAEDALAFLADQLGWRSDPHCALGEYFQGNFFAHHAKLYCNRPIYWLCPHKQHPVLLYYHALGASTANRLAKLRRSGMTAELKQARKNWAALDKNEGIAPHIFAAAALGLAKLPPVLARKQKERTNAP